MKLSMNSFFHSYMAQNLVSSLIVFFVVLFMPKAKKYFKATQIYKILIFIHILYVIPLCPILVKILNYFNVYKQPINISSNKNKLQMYNVYAHIMIDYLQKKAAIEIRYIFNAFLLTVSIVLILLDIYKHYKKMKIIGRWNKTSQNLDLMNTFNELKVTNKKNTSIKLVENEMIISPMVVGIFRQTIFFPTKICIENMNMVKVYLYHEITHINKRDNLVAALSRVLTRVFWYNPAIYILSKITNLYCEIACDESVLCNINTTLGFRDEYLNTIRETLIWQNNSFLLGKHFYYNKKDIMERIKAINCDNEKKKMPLVFPSLFIIFILSCIPVYRCLSLDNIQLYVKCKEIIQSTDLSMKDDMIVELIHTVNYNEFYNYASYGLLFDGVERRLYYDGKLVRNFEDNRKNESTVLYYPDGDIDIVTIYENNKIVGIQEIKIY